MGIYYIASCRKDPKNEVSLSDKVKFYSRVNLHYRTDVPVGHPGVILDQTNLERSKDLDEVMNEIAQLGMTNSRVLFLAHGYNVQENEALDVYGDLVQKLEASGFHYDVYIFMLWPGSFAKLGFWPANGRAEKCGKMMAEVIDRFTMTGFTCDVEAHSLGCYLWLEAMRHMNFQAGNLILTAPAADNNSLTFGKGPYARISAIFKRVTVCWSENDPVLKYAYLYGQGVWRVLSLNVVFQGIHKALGLTGPKPEFDRNVRAFNFSKQVTSHSGYRSCPDFYQSAQIWNPDSPTA